MQSPGEVRDKSPAIVQSRQIVVVGQVLEPLHGGNASLELRKQ
jgi:hypothetical protein